jgi:hypothetical protein
MNGESSEAALFLHVSKSIVTGILLTEKKQNREMTGEDSAYERKGNLGCTAQILGGKSET